MFKNHLKVTVNAKKTAEIWSLWVYTVHHRNLHQFTHVLHRNSFQFAVVLLQTQRWMIARKRVATP